MILLAITFLFPALLYSVGGGILPYVVQKTKRTRTVYFLLGREAHGHAKGTWADFGGGGHKGETAKQTAIREGSEETMNIISPTFIRNYINTHKKAWKCGNTYLINIEKLVGKNPNFNSRKKFIDRFDKKRKNLINAQNLKKRGMREKDKFSWWKKGDLIGAIRQKSNRLRPNFIHRYKNCISRLNRL